MIEISDGSPRVNVPPAEYTRLLGYPRGWTLDGRAQELGDWARDWYAHHGRPWTYARGVGGIQINDGAVVIDGVRFNSSRLSATLAAAGADRAFLVAVSAGPELEEEAQVRWRDGKPDEYFFLEVYGSAVVEHLVTMTGARLCAWADTAQAAVLPHYSPGYPEWTIDEQPMLLDVIRAPHPAASASRSARVRNAAAEEVAAGRLRCDPAPRSRPSADGIESLRRLFVRAVPVPPGAVPPFATTFAIRVADRC